MTPPLDRDERSPEAVDRPRRGRPPRIARDQIVAVARTFDASDATMQAIADELGVDRKAIHYYVRTREDLLELVAAEIVRTNLDRVNLATLTDWRDVLRSFALGMRTAIVDTGSFAPYLNSSAIVLGSLRSVETVLRSLLAAGFDEIEAGHALNFVGEFVFMAAQNELSTRGEQVPRRSVDVRRELERLTDEEEFSALNRVAAVAGFASAWGDSLRDFDIGVAISGLEQLLRLKQDAVRPG
jgi:TetR/AcrR family tetracycline transcriptional repressor